MATAFAQANVAHRILETARRIRLIITMTCRSSLNARGSIRCQKPRMAAMDVGDFGAVETGSFNWLPPS
jgi:hypothetical protein